MILKVEFYLGIAPKKEYDMIEFDEFFSDSSKFIAKKLNESLAYYRILSKSRSRKKLQAIYWLWHINKNFNKINFIKNLILIIFVIINSIKKYGIK